MSNRNFDSRVIIQRLQNRVYSRNLYNNNTTGHTIITNPQTTDGDSSRYVTYHSGAQTEYFRSLEGTTTISQGGIADIPPYPSIPVSRSTPIIPTLLSFTALGRNSWTAPEGITSINYLLVGGGGGSGGGYDTGGGGGGGGGMVRSGTTSVTPGTTYMVVVGDGGIGGTSNRLDLPETDGTPGINSSFDAIVALGGSGGYASRFGPPNSAGGTAAINPSTASEGGHGGGSAGDGNGSGGGGGGSTGAGANGVANVGGDGGAGTSSSISGSAVTYGTGGRGANGNSNNAAVAGTANTGNGARGGGAVSFANENGARGGSGIVIISYGL
jgi:hypothetical protein